jgi:hypothetical protein
MGEMIIHYPQTGPEMNADTGVQWAVYEYGCGICGRTMVEVTPDFEPPEYPLCAFCRPEPLAGHLRSEIVEDAV